MSLGTQVIIYILLGIVAVILVCMLAYFLEKNMRMSENLKDSRAKSDDDIDTSENKFEDVLKREDPNKVLVPDNVKKESQLESTQEDDAPEYDVNSERKGK
jgi:FtsZ-interacting cell division protein ZipA